MGDTFTEAQGRHQAALDRAAIFQALYEVERLAEQLESDDDTWDEAA